MKISYNWLKDYLSITSTPEEAGAMLTASGLEVESLGTFQKIPGGLQGLVVGLVLEKWKHPNADKLSVTKVDIGDGAIYQIVCGAPNVEQGQKVIIATVGARLCPIEGEPFEIKKSKIRGEVSEGMICAEDEIGLGNSHAGIMILPPDTPVGTQASVYFNITSDTIFEIGLTPNRADATSHMGVARDLAAVWNVNRLLDAKLYLPSLHLNKPNVDAFQGTGPCPVQVYVADRAACPRYAGVFISGITVMESPAWLKEKLLAIGLKPINNLVDLTNFILFETGQPLHAFDADQIRDKKIHVKTLPAGTSFTTLDGVDRKLNGEELMICDSEQGLCMAGVYGGINSGISNQTSTIFIESAYFNPTIIRKASRQHNLKTDASFRFERGADPDIVVYALKRAVILLQQMNPGISVSEITDYYPEPIPYSTVHFSLNRMNELAGVTISKDILLEIIDSLEIRLLSETPVEWVLEVPPFKPDVNRPADVMEEILRIYGYDRIPLPDKMNSMLPAFPKPDRLEMQQQVSNYLASQGFSEMMGNSLTRKDYHNLPGLPGEAIQLLNPLSNDLALMRQTLLFSGLEAIAYNQNRRNNDLRLFEFGKVYFKKEGRYLEENHLMLVLTGKRQKPHWMPTTAGYSIYFLKSMLLNVLTKAGLRNTENLVFSEISDDQGSIMLSCSGRNQTLARLGIVKNNILKTFDIAQEVFMIHLFLDPVFNLINKTDLQVSDIPRFPEVKRDLSMVLDMKTKYEQVEKMAFESEKKFLKRIQLFDIYQGDKIEPGKKSYAISFILGDDMKTLEDKQIDAIMEKLMKNFETNLGAVIRRSA